MDQITRTVNQFLALIVGLSLICFFSFIILLASAQLNNSLLGDLLARVAGETARTARTESFSYWGRVGSEVASGLGYGRPLTTGGGSPAITPVVIVATQPPSGPTATPAPTPTPLPASYIRSSPYSEGGLLLWRGLDTSSKPLSNGVSLEQVQQQARFALGQHSGDLLALWLMRKVNECRPLYDQMVGANYQDPAQASAIRAAADSLIGQCNPRLLEAYARKRWAELSAWLAQQPLDEGQALTILAGLPIAIGEKIDGPARGFRPQDHVEVTVLPLSAFGLAPATFQLTVATLDELLGAGQWELNNTYAVPGELFPANPPEPALPTEADLTPPTNTPAPAPQQSAPSAPTTPGRYVVQGGDTVYSIARQFNITPQALVAANPTTLGVNPNYILPGQELNIPAAP